jgi:hypothetical protein
MVLMTKFSDVQLSQDLFSAQRQRDSQQQLLDVAEAAVAVASIDGSLLKEAQHTCGKIRATLRTMDETIDRITRWINNRAMLLSFIGEQPGVPVTLAVLRVCKLEFPLDLDTWVVEHGFKVRWEADAETVHFIKN